MINNLLARRVGTGEWGTRSWTAEVGEAGGGLPSDRSWTREGTREGGEAGEELPSNISCLKF